MVVEVSLLSDLHVSAWRNVITVRKVAELAVQMFITADKPNVSGLVLAGSADFKSELQTSDMFDQRLASDYQCCN